MALLETAVGVLSTVVLGVVGWAITLGNRVSVLESKREDLMLLINEKFDALNKRLDRLEVSMGKRTFDD